jgi:periplasmic divalent cation tolerance protein
MVLAHDASGKEEIARPMTALFVYVTAGSREEAERLARAVVEERLAACANILPPIRSYYRWQGRTEEAEEVAIVMKTVAERFDALAARVRALHSYELPAIVALPIAAGLPAYLEWIAAETAGG